MQMKENLHQSQHNLLCKNCVCTNHRGGASHQAWEKLDPEFTEIHYSKRFLFLFLFSLLKRFEAVAPGMALNCVVVPR